jgi:antitoxin ParD1/3/4
MFMNVNLGPVLDRFVSEMLKTGLYQSQSEVLREGLRLLKEREDLRKMRLAEMRKQIALGTRQADEGVVMDGSNVFAKIRARSARRRRAIA